MILILHQDAAQALATRVANGLQEAYGGALRIELLSADKPIEREVDPAWDDLLIVIYRDGDFTPAGKGFLERYRKATAGEGFVLPVALDPDHPSLPVPYEGIKAIPFGDPATSHERIDRRVGAMLGLKLRSRDTRVFISYRATDGAAIATQLERFLESRGYHAWRDESRDEFDGEGNILGGKDVQQAIAESVKDADLLLLVDTPRVPESRWIQLEIDHAIASLLPVLPVCCRERGDSRQGSRLRSLRELQRFVGVELRAGAAVEPLSQEELKEVVREMENYLCEIYRRRLRVPFLAAKAFTTRDWEWTELDRGQLLFRSLKKRAPRYPKSEVLSHCSVYDEVYRPALRRFADYVRREPAGTQANFRLFLYDGDLLQEPEIERLFEEGELANILVVHHQELAMLLDSNFTVLR